MEFPALNMSVEPQVERPFDSASNAISYIVKDLALQACAIIDSVLERAQHFCFGANSLADSVEVNIL